MRHTYIRLTLAIIEVFIGLAALGGGIALLAGTMDQWLPRAFLQGTPFADYTIPGLALTILIGGGMLLAAATVFMRRAWTVLLSLLMGFAMLCFEIVEIAAIDRFAEAVIPASIMQQILFTTLALVIMGLAAYLWMVGYRHPRLARI